MHTRGFPELHIWARPSLGQDPGYDWKLSANDRCRVLNDLGGMLVDGRLTVGSQVTRKYDAGQATVTFRVDPPGDPGQLEAYGVPPGVDVLPVLWSPQRPAEGTLTGLTPAAEERPGRRTPRWSRTWTGLVGPRAAGSCRRVPPSGLTRSSGR